MRYKFTLIAFFLPAVLFAKFKIKDKPGREVNHEVSKSFKQRKSEKPGAVCLYFLKWYVSEKNWFDEHGFFQIPLSKDTITPYKVNYENLKKYKVKLKKSGRVSDVFLENVQMQYDSAANYFKLNPQYDGPIEGFNTDPVIQLQEEDMLTDYIKKIKVGSVRYEYGNCYVRVTVNKYVSYIFVLSKHKGKWLIDSIAPRL